MYTYVVARYTYHVVSCPVVSDTCIVLWSCNIVLRIRNVPDSIQCSGTLCPIPGFGYGRHRINMCIVSDARFACPAKSMCVKERLYITYAQLIHLKYEYRYCIRKASRKVIIDRTTIIECKPHIGFYHSQHNKKGGASRSVTHGTQPTWALSNRAIYQHVNYLISQTKRQPTTTQTNFVQ